MKKINLTIAIFIVLVVLGALFYISKTKKNTPVVIETKLFEIFINKGKLVTDLGVIHATQGDTVIFKILDDEQEEFHVHGYDKSIEIVKNVPAILTLTANLTGKFPFELENSKTELGVLEVEPK
ncbi:hypothetical protein H0W91_01090 [Patescibacteria group bacterium]|nr:hypothetical protein [Patescibacteria group bacterium]